MEVTLDLDLFFSIICRDGVIMAPIRILKYLPIFQKMYQTQSNKPIYTSDAKEYISLMIGLLVDQAPKSPTLSQLRAMIQDYQLNLEGIRDVHTYVTLSSHLDDQFIELKLPIIVPNQHGWEKKKLHLIPVKVRHSLIQNNGPIQPLALARAARLHRKHGLPPVNMTHRETTTVYRTKHGIQFYERGNYLLEQEMKFIPHTDPFLEHLNLGKNGAFIPANLDPTLSFVELANSLARKN